MGNQKIKSSTIFVSAMALGAITVMTLESLKIDSLKRDALSEAKHADQQRARAVFAASDLRSYVCRLHAGDTTKQTGFGAYSLAVTKVTEAVENDSRNRTVDFKFFEGDVANDRMAIASQISTPCPERPSEILTSFKPGEATP